MKRAAAGVVQLSLVMTSLISGVFLTVLSIMAENLTCVFALFPIHEKPYCNDIGLMSLHHIKVTKYNTFFQILFCFLIHFQFFDMHAIQDFTHMHTYTYIRINMFLFLSELFTVF